MKSVSDVLRDADPLRHEAPQSDDERERVRRAVLDAGSDAGAHASIRLGTSRAPAALLAGIAVISVIIVSVALAGSKMWSGGSATLHAEAVRFEVRLADESFSPGLREARVQGSGALVYLHQEIIVTNDDISDSRITAGDTPSRFGVAVAFTAAGAEKMRQATAGHVGGLIAVLIDGEVVLAPRLRSPISESAVITGDYTRAEAERIANGMRIR